jgi:hypothetical protein
MDFVAFLSAVGLPARLGARILFLPRYILDSFAGLRPWPRNTYARARYGTAFYWQVWLLFDIKELEALERLINDGSDEELWRMRETQLESVRLVALVVCECLLFWLPPFFTNVRVCVLKKNHNRARCWLRWLFRRSISPSSHRQAQ